MLTKTKTTYLVIGYGNTLRHDDGAGYKVAEAVADWGIEGVRSLPLHQLTPDLAEAIAHAKIVIFVDAVAETPEAQPTIKVERLEPSSRETFTGHCADPRSLLAFAKILYGTLPIAYRILIPAFDFSFGEMFSPITEAGISIALSKIKELIRFSEIERRE
ncbi:MAG: hydrogenase maturation protease [Leptolyngbyaceae bacterium]|nr:hydrogenase maturation protease [Leptolyngbyaceae bacterium]